MNLQELKDAIDEAVNEYGPGILKRAVFASYNYGDHCHTQAVTKFDSLEFMQLEETAYSCTGLAVPEDWEEQTEKEWEAMVIAGEHPPCFVLI